MNNKPDDAISLDMVLEILRTDTGPETPGGNYLPMAEIIKRIDSLPRLPTIAGAEFKMKKS